MWKSSPSTFQIRLKIWGTVILPILGAWAYFGTWHLSKRHFSTRTFWHEYFSAPWTFGHGDITTLGHFDTKIFQHMDILAQGHLWRNVYIALHDAKMYMSQNVHVPKYPCAQMFQCCKVPVPKRPLCQNILMPKFSRAKIFSCRNVLAPKSPSDEMSVPKCLLPKCQVPK